MRIKKTLEFELEGVEAALRKRLDELGLTVQEVCDRASISRATWYAVVGDAAPVSFSLLVVICRALDTTPEDLGVAFAPEPQKLRPIADAEAGVPVLGVWFHVAGNDFCSCYLSDEGKWLDTAAGLNADNAVLDPPDGFIDLPIISEEETNG